MSTVVVQPADAGAGEVQSTPKILHVVLSMKVGGAEKLVYDMVRHSSFADKRPVVCCLDELGELGQQLRAEGYAVYVKGRRSGIDFSLIPWLAGIIRKESAGVVHAHQYTPLFYATPAALLAGRVRIVYTEHGRFYPERRSWKRSLFNPVLALGVDHLVSISQSTAQAMAEFDNLPLRRIRVVHNGVTLPPQLRSFDAAAKRRELGLSEACKVVGAAARLNEIKNIPMIIRAFRQVSDSVPEACLVIAGEGPESEKLRELAADLGVAEKVKFLGVRFDMAEIYPLFDVFLLSSFSEGISITLLEAMANGVPVVVTDVGGNPEVVVEGVTGYLVPSGSETSLAQRTAQLLTDPLLSHEMGKQGQERVWAHFGFDRMVEAYRCLYEGRECTGV